MIDLGKTQVLVGFTAHLLQRLIHAETSCMNLLQYLAKFITRHFHRSFNNYSHHYTINLLPTGQYRCIKMPPGQIRAAAIRPKNRFLFLKKEISL